VDGRQLAEKPEYLRRILGDFELSSIEYIDWEQKIIGKSTLIDM